MSPEAPTLLPRAYYVATVTAFLSATPETVLGTLTGNSDMAVEPAQRNAWLEQISILKANLPGVAGTLFLEFNLPRMGRRIDAVLVSGPVIFVIEFKIGEARYLREDIDQVWDYALDLKNFYEASHGAPILPILVASKATATDRDLPLPHDAQRLSRLADSCTSGNGHLRAPGVGNDPTRKSAFYDPTYNCLSSLGIPVFDP